MAYEGYVDSVNNVEIRGWAFDNSFPNDPLTLEILAEGRVVATVCADQHRPDLAAAGKGTGFHAFSYQMKSKVSDARLAARIVGKRWPLPHAGRASPVPIRFDRRLAHSLEYGIPKVEEAFSVAQASPDEAGIVDRVIEAYHRALADDPRRKDRKLDIWSQLATHHHREILELLERRDVRGVTEYLREAHAKDLTFGITQGSHTTEQLRTRADARELVLLQYLDRLTSLAEYLGVLDVESPEQNGQWGENFQIDPDTLASRISAAIGIQMATGPVIGSYFGIKTKEGVVTGRDVCALYAALRLRVIAEDLGLQNAEICEIGGGLGGVAYYAALLGIGRYTIIDLPLVGVLQGYFLLRALPNLKICLYGERESPDAAVFLLPTFCFDRPDRQYDILLNQDSIPEMHPDYSLGYLRQARKNVRHAFLSINQEARAPQSEGVCQTVVRELVKEVGGYRQVNRSRHWLQAGYVEELYRVGGESS
jgi:putative sugar O-methyltransferase